MFVDTSVCSRILFTSDTSSSDKSTRYGTEKLEAGAPLADNRFVMRAFHSRQSTAAYACECDFSIDRPAPEMGNPTLV